MTEPAVAAGFFPAPPAAVLPTWEQVPLRSPRALVAVWDNPAQEFHDGCLSLVTVQPRAAYESLAETGSLTGDWAAVANDLRPAYRFMVEQMAVRGGSRVDQPPVWLWARVPIETLRRDLVARRGEGAVLVRVSVPHERVVVSTHEGWHRVLNRQWCPAPGQPDRAYARFLDEVDALFGHTRWTFEELPARLRVKVEASWRWCLVPELFGPAAAVQAVVPRVEAADVVSVVRLESSARSR